MHSLFCFVLVFIVPPFKVFWFLFFGGFFSAYNSKEKMWLPHFLYLFWMTEWQHVPSSHLIPKLNTVLKTAERYWYKKLEDHFSFSLLVNFFLSYFYPYWQHFFFFYLQKVKSDIVFISWILTWALQLVFRMDCWTSDKLIFCLHTVLLKLNLFLDSNSGRDLWAVAGHVGWEWVEI